VRLFNSAGEYRPTTGDPGGRGFRRSGDWTVAGCAGCTACERVKDAKEGMARAARKAGFARGGDEVEGTPPDATGWGACILTINPQLKS
jgi:hypothetical protein